MKIVNSKQVNRLVSIILLWMLLMVQSSFGQAPAGYYDNANGKTGYQLKTALKNIITNGHNDQGYDALFTLYQSADVDKYYENDNTLLDMYSEIPSGADSYEYTQTNDKCGNYSSEGDCYNREHLMPQSVFGSASPMKNDGHFVVPADGKVNSERSNYAFGVVSNPTWTSTNGSKLGPNATAGYSDTVFEPIDEFKGDIARMLFYFATRYEDQVASWSHPMLNGTSDQVFSDWFLDILLQWNANDPVSQKEIDRNEAVYNYQGNRNPFIDHPEWVNDIWGNNNNGNTGNGSTCVDEDFVDWADWTNHGTSEDTSSSHYGVASPCRAFASSDYMISPAVDNPNLLQFHQDASNSGDGETVTLDYQIGSNGWVQFYSFSANKNGVDESVDLTNLSGVDLSAEADVTFRFNAPAGGTWYLDDVVVSCGATSSNDSDAYASGGTQPAAGTIDSMKDTSAEAVDVFVMDIYDKGTADGLDTEITNIRLKPYTTNNADWTDNIQGFVIKNGATVISPTNVNITDTYVDFTFNSGDLTVPDNNLIELTFSVYLNTSNIQDGKILSFMVDAADHGFTADSSGTQFETTFEDGDFHSNDFTIDVSVSELQFTQQPTNVEENTVMSPSVTVAATDANGNIDTEFDGSGATIGLTTSGSFDASATTQVDAVQGVATFDNIIFDTTASGITLTTTDPDNWGYTNATSNTFDVTAAGAGPCATELIISEYIEGSSNNKYLEFYNGTGATINLDDYDIRIYSNGSSSISSTIHLNNTSLADGDVYILAHSSANAWGGTPNQTSGSLGFNGDDAIELYNTATGNAIDIIGQIGTDPGSQWGSGSTTTKDHTLVRKAAVTTGDTNGSDSFDPATEWDGYAKDDVSHLGSHTMTCGACEAPVTDAVFDSNSPQSLTSLSATLSWSNGGGNKRIVIIRANNPVSFVPADNTTYVANATYGAGTDISGNGEYVIYNDTGSQINVSGLTAGTLYYVKIFEYNCNPGSEKYYVSGTPAEDYFVTIPYNVNSFDVNCRTNTTANLSWTAPSAGDFDGYLLVVREGNNTPHSVFGTAPSAVSGANLDYSQATEFGSTTPKSKYLYLGTNTNVTVTGLTAGTQYTFKLYTYREFNAVYKYSSGTQTQIITGINDVADAHASPGNTQATVYWINPNTCYDEILVVANETSGIDFTPTGNGSSYTANPNYTAPNQVVYKGTGNNVVVSNLNNGTTYYFEIFVRKGSEWSNGIEVSTTPVLATTFQPGQLIFVGYDGQYKGSGADDEYLIATLIDIEPGTTFSLVNSRYEAGAPANVRTNKWGSGGDDASKNPGVAEITYNGATNIPAGSILRLHTKYDVAFLDYVGVITGTSETDQTADFSTSLPYGTTSIPNISSSGSDQLYLVQGVFIFDGYEDAQQANYTLQGTLLHGITNRASWVDLSQACNGDSSGGNSRESRLHPSLNCFNIENSNTSAISGFYQNDELHTGSFRDIILALSNSTYWTLGTGRYNVDPATTNDADTGHTFTISGGHNPGTWVSTSDTNWFNCSNWETLAVPDATTDVYIDANSTVNAVVDNTANYADLFNGEAVCHNLTISNLNLNIEGSNTLIVYGDLDIQSSAHLDANDGDNTTPDADITVMGNWTTADNTAFDQGNSTIHLSGTTPQTISSNGGADTEEFYNLEINNPAGVSFASGNIHAENDLTITAATPYDITDGHYILAGHNLVNNTDITIENQASLVQTDDTGNISGTGTFTLNKTSLPLNHYYDYVYWSSPINSSAFSLGDIVSNAWRYYKFDPNEANNGHTYPGWVMLSAADVPDKGVGYAISAPTGAAANTILSPVFVKDHDPFNNGEIQKIVLRKGGPDDNGNYNLLGNPYPSAIDFDALANDPDNNDIADSYSLWTNCAELDANGHHQASGYATYVVSGTATDACGNQGTATQYIATGQGFMVEALNDNGTMKFKNAYRVTGNNDGFLNRPASNNNRNVLWLDLLDDNGKFSQTAIGFYDGATSAFDVSYDAHSLNVGSGFTIYSLSQNDKLVIQGLPRQDIFNQTVPLGIETATAQQVKFHLNHLQNFDNYNIYLKDNTLNITHDLKASDYIVNVYAGTDDSRFELVFNTTTGVNENAITDDNLVLTQNHGIFNLLLRGDGKINKIQVYTLQGQLLLQKTDLSENDYQINLESVSNGNLLLFKVYTDNQHYYIKKAIKM